MRFIILVEGKTEKNTISDFIKRWLDPQLSKPVRIQPVKIPKESKDFDKIKTMTVTYLEGTKSDSIIAVIGLLDLYGQEFYPDNLTTTKERYNWAVQEIGKKVNSDKFRMFFAVHELEAWLLSQPEILPREVAERLPKKSKSPETVNFNKPPSKLLIELYKPVRNRNYHKSRDGKALFSRLDPDIAYRKCPYLHKMLDEMLHLAKQAGC